MEQADRVFAGSIPEVYDRLMVPMQFEPMARDMAARVAALAPDSVLETAAGSGALTRELLPRLGAEACYAATDLNPPMLERAQARMGPDPRLAFRPADAKALPYEDGVFDVVVCQFGVMFFPDRVAAYREARRVLRSGGRFLFSAWDRVEANSFAQAVHEALAVVLEGEPPAFVTRVPHGYHDPDRMRADLEAAGFSGVVVEPVEMESRAESAMDVAVAKCQGTPIRAEIEARRPGDLERVTAEVAREVARLLGEGPLRGRLRAWVAEGVAP
jgi:ubiquinone/menaquinone biosynthesis C-methylase UbiE